MTSGPGGLREDILAAIDRTEANLRHASPEAFTLRFFTELREAVRHAFKNARDGKPGDTGPVPERVGRLLVWAAHDGISARILVPAGAWNLEGESLEILNGGTVIGEFNRSAILGVALAIDGIEDDLGDTAMLREQLDIATGALRDIRDGLKAGDFGHDTAHKALDEIGDAR